MDTTQERDLPTELTLLYNECDARAQELIALEKRYVWYGRFAGAAIFGLIASAIPPGLWLYRTENRVTRMRSPQGVKQRTQRILVSCGLALVGAGWATSPLGFMKRREMFNHKAAAYDRLAWSTRLLRWQVENSVATEAKAAAIVEAHAPPHLQKVLLPQPEAPDTAVQTEDGVDFSGLMRREEMEYPSTEERRAMWRDVAELDMVDRAWFVLQARRRDLGGEPVY